MKKNIEKILLFSNPFGYGPTITLLHIVEELTSRTHVKLIVVGKDNGLCKEIFMRSKHPKNIDWVDLDERNYDEVKALIYKNQNALIISILNRFCVRAAHELNIPNVLIDFLSWFWDSPAEEYKLADKYFTNNLNKPVRNINQNIIDIPIILGPVPPIMEKKDRSIILINIGGAQNPLVKGIPKKYLKFLGEMINKLDFGNSEVFIAGGESAMKYVNQVVVNKNYNIGSIPHEQFLNLHSKSKLFISLSGTNATFMSYALKVPTILLPPQLLAHWKLSKVLIEANIPSIIMWENYFPINETTYRLSEKEIVPYTERLSDKMLRNRNDFNHMVARIQQLINNHPGIDQQTNFIDSVGIGGEKVLVSKLKKKWNI